MLFASTVQARNMAQWLECEQMCSNKRNVIIPNDTDLEYGVTQLIAQVSPMGPNEPKSARLDPNGLMWA